MEFKEFTEHDWYMYGGAESTEDGRKPLMGQDELRIVGLPLNIITQGVITLSCAVMVDANGIFIDAFGENRHGEQCEETYGWGLHLSTNDVWKQTIGYDLGKLIAERLKPVEQWDDLRNAGFKTANIPGLD